MSGTELVITLVVILATGPLTVWAVRLARKYRRGAMATASVLMLFGMNVTIDPPPPQRTERTEDDEEAGSSGEPL